MVRSERATYLIWTLMLVTVLPSGVAAQRGRGGPPVTSPEVGADRRVTFRLSAPAAQQVVVAGELDGKPHPMTKGPDGVTFVVREGRHEWSVWRHQLREIAPPLFR